METQMEAYQKFRGNTDMARLQRFLFIGFRSEIGKVAGTER